MDAVRVSSGSIRRPLQDAPHRYRVTSDNYTNRPKPPSSAKLHYDRFIPNRRSMDMDLANLMLTEPKKEMGNIKSPSKDAYRKALSETLFQNRTRILSFKSKPQTSIGPIPLEPSQNVSSQQQQHAKLTRQRRHIPQSAVRMLGAPDIIDDYYLNLVDWGCKNVFAIALGSTVYLWDASTRSTSELVTVDESCGHVTSVNWAPDGKNIAIGLNNSDIQLWDSYSNRLLRTLKGTHDSRVGALSWNDHLLTSGGMDGLIVNSDVRIRDHVVNTYEGHTEEVCGLKWSGSGQQLASGGSDSLLHIWDLSMASSRAPPNQHQWLHRRNDHVATVKALAWCPLQNNLLASGGGGGDRCIKFWNTQTGACLNSVDTGSQVSGLLWNKNEMDLLSSHGHGFTMENQLTLWKYPSMMKMAELTGHTSRVLFMAQSPDGSTVASAGADEELRFWNVFGTPQPPKPAKSVKSLSSAPFSSFSFIR